MRIPGIPGTAVSALVLSHLSAWAVPDPRYIHSNDDLIPFLKERTANPFLYPGVWVEPAPEPVQALPVENPSPAQTVPKAPDPLQPKSPRDERFLARIDKLMQAEYGAVTVDETPGSSPSPTMATETAADPEPGVRVLKPYLSFTAPYLAEISLGGKATEGECRMAYSSSNESQIVQLYDEILLECGDNDGVRVGDLFQTYEVGSSYRSYVDRKSLGRLITVNGVLEITRTTPTSSVGRLVRCFGTLSRKTRATPLAPADTLTARGYAPAEGKPMVQRVIWVTPPNQLPQPFASAIIDEGTDKGIRIGDLVVILDKRSGKMTANVLAQAIVVQAKPHSATLLLQDVQPGIINSGDFAVVQMRPVP